MPTRLAHRLTVTLTLDIYMPEGHSIPPKELDHIGKDLVRVAKSAIDLAPPDAETLRILKVYNACEWETSAAHLDRPNTVLLEEMKRATT